MSSAIGLKEDSNVVAAGRSSLQAVRVPVHTRRTMSPKVVLFVALVALVCISGALAGSSRKHAISSVGVRPTGLDMDCPLCTSICPY
jgi:hypothetical protein